MAWLLGKKCHFLLLFWTETWLLEPDLHTEKPHSNLVQMIPQFVLIPTIEGYHNKVDALHRLQHVNSYPNCLSHHPPLIQAVRKMYFDKGFAVDFQCSQFPVHK